MKPFVAALCGVVIVLLGASLFPFHHTGSTAPAPSKSFSAGLPVSAMGYLDAHAEAGPSQTSDEGSPVALDGRASSGSANYTGVGLVFVKDSGLRVAPGGALDSSGAFAPDIVRLPNGSFRMYYGGVSGRYTILSAFSPNGFDWNKEPGIRIDVGGVYDSDMVLYPRVWILGNGTYRMYYTGSDGSSWRILSATSTDGIIWAKESGVRVDVGGINDPSRAFSGEVVVSGGLLRMYYSGGTASTYRILSATSTDGLSWTKESGIRMDIGGPSQTGFVAHPAVTNFSDGIMRMYYHGFDGAHSRMFSATSTDGLAFVLDPGIRIDIGPTYDSDRLGYPEVFWVNSTALRLYYAGNDGSRLYVLSALSQPTRYPIAAYSWDFDARIDGDANGNFTDDADAVGAQVSHQYDDNGVYAVTLRVQDANNSVASDATWITVANKPPAISVSPPLPAVEGSPVAVNITLTDPGSDDLRLTWYWQYASGGTSTFFNNGISPDLPNSSVGTAPFMVSQPLFLTYHDDGIYSLYVNATDDDGGATSSVSAILVQNGAPAPFVVMGPPDVPVGTSRGYSANASDPGSDDLTFLWDWGDASFNNPVHYNNGMSPDPDPSPGGTSPFATLDSQTHSWSATGTYRVGVTVRDDDGGSRTMTLDVRVHALPSVAVMVGDPHQLGAMEFVTSHSPITFNATDRSGFGIDRIEYRVDNGSWQIYSPGTPAFLAPEGTRRVDARSVDGIGGVSNVTSREFVVDDTAPTSDLNVGNPRHTTGGATYVTANTSLTLSGTDRGAIPVGLAGIEFRFDAEPSWQAYGAAISLAGLTEGVHSVWVRASDTLGNVETAHGFDLVLDVTPPASLMVVRETSEDTWTLNVTSADPGCGVASIEYSVDGRDWLPYQGDFTVSGYGPHTVRYRGTDCVGNVEPFRQYAVEIVPPLNVKPFLAVIFALVILILGLYLRSKREGRKEKSRALYGAVVFAAIELVTGAASLYLGPLLRVPPVLGLGTMVDVAILAVGLALTWLLARSRSVDSAPPREE